MAVRWWPTQRLKVGGESTLLINNANFSRLWAAQGLSQIAQNMLNFALIIRVFDLAQGTRLANVSVALVILSFGVPSIFFAAAAGVYVDHWNRKHVLVIANLLRALLVLGYLFVEHNLALVLLLSFLISSITQFFAPAEAASIPVLVGKKNLLRANSLFIFTMYASFMVGYASSAPVIGMFGSKGPYFLTSIMFLLATLLVAGLPSMKSRKRQAVKFWSLIKMTRHEVVQNWHIIRTNHKLSFPILQLTITQAIVGVILALAPALSLAVLKTPIQNASQVLIIPAGLGMILGVVAVGKLASKYPRIRLISVSLIIAAATLFMLGLSGLLHRSIGGHSATIAQIGAYVALLLIVLGFMNAVVSSAAQTLLQENTTDETRGKVFGALNMMVNIAATLPILFAGILADLTGVTKVVGFIGFALLVFAIGQYYVLRSRGQLQTR
jgi:MFS family permease